jgi:nitroimidazol reductase NimA-like FMN-containing flavoprotein (pyridoxamine 5'-phosphate oxidase superfamily)
MFREMRRKKQVLSTNECLDVINRGTSGVLAVIGDDNYPYAVPLSYVYYDNKIYFHGAKTGHKLDAVTKNEKVSFCIIDQDQVVPDEYTTYFRSVILFGKARVIDDETEKRNAINMLALRYAPSHDESRRQQAIENEYKAMAMIELTIEHMSGKEAIELIRQKNRNVI